MPVGQSNPEIGLQSAKITTQMKMTSDTLITDRYNI